MGIKVVVNLPVNRIAYTKAFSSPLAVAGLHRISQRGGMCGTMRGKNALL